MPATYAEVRLVHTRVGNVARVVDPELFDGEAGQPQLQVAVSNGGFTSIFGALSGVPAVVSGTTATVIRSVNVIATPVLAAIDVIGGSSTVTAPSAKPDWYYSLDNIIESQVTYPPEEDYPTADASAQLSAVEVARTLYDEVGHAVPEPYFDVALDSGVDIYFDYGANELQVHIPPPISENRYCFVRLGGERKVHRHPTVKQLANFLIQVVAEDGLPAE